MTKADKLARELEDILLEIKTSTDGTAKHVRAMMALKAKVTATNVITLLDEINRLKKEVEAKTYER